MTVKMFALIYDTGGLICIQGLARSKAADAASTVSSSPLRPMMCSPIGMPSDVKPHGMLAAVWPIVFIGWVKGTKPHAALGYTSFPPICFGYSPTGNAGTGMAGEPDHGRVGPRGSMTSILIWEGGVRPGLIVPGAFPR